MVKVLIADDSPAQLELMANLLRKQHFDVRTAHDGLEAIALAQHLKLDLIILDVEMPKMNGFQVCRHLRHLLIKTPIIICSTMTSSVASHWAVKNGANGYIPKNDVAQELLNLIDRLV